MSKNQIHNCCSWAECNTVGQSESVLYITLSLSKAKTNLTEKLYRIVCNYSSRLFPHHSFMIPNALVLIFTFRSRKAPYISRALRVKYVNPLKTCSTWLKEKPNHTAMNQLGTFFRLNLSTWHSADNLTFLANMHIQIIFKDMPRTYI